MSRMTLRMLTPSRKININMLQTGDVVNGIHSGIYVKSYTPGMPDLSDGLTLDDVTTVEDQIDLIIAGANLMQVNKLFARLLKALNAAVLFFDDRADEPVFIKFKPIDGVREVNAVIIDYTMSSAPKMVGDDTRVQQEITLTIEREIWRDIEPPAVFYDRTKLYGETLFPEDKPTPQERNTHIIYPEPPIGDFPDWEGKYWGTRGVTYAVTANRYAVSNLGYIFIGDSVIEGHNSYSGTGLTLVDDGWNRLAGLPNGGIGPEANDLSTTERQLGLAGHLDIPTYFGITDYAWPPSGVVCELKYEAANGEPGYAPVTMLANRMGRDYFLSYSGNIVNSVSHLDMPTNKWGFLTSNGFRFSGRNILSAGTGWQAKKNTFETGYGEDVEYDGGKVYSYHPRNSWTKTSVHGINGYWFRIKTDYEPDDNTGRPVAWRYKPFVPWRPYVEYNKVGGDLPADVILRIDQLGGTFRDGIPMPWNPSPPYDSNRPDTAWGDPTTANTLWIGLRSKKMSPRRLGDSPQFAAGYYNFGWYGKTEVYGRESWNPYPHKSEGGYDDDNPYMEDYYGSVSSGGGTSWLGSETDYKYQLPPNSSNWRSTWPDPQTGPLGVYAEAGVWTQSMGPGYISIAGNSLSNQGAYLVTQEAGWDPGIPQGVLRDTWGRAGTIFMTAGAGTYRVFLRYSMHTQLDSDVAIQPYIDEDDYKIAALNISARITTDPTLSYNETGSLDPEDSPLAAGAYGSGSGGISTSVSVPLNPTQFQVNGHIPVVADFGVMRFAPSPNFVGRAFVTPVTVELMAPNANALHELRLYDLIMIPVDEAVLGIKTAWPPYYPYGLDGQNFYPAIVYDGISTGNGRAVVLDPEYQNPGADIQAIAQVITSQKFRVPANDDFRLYTFGYTEAADSVGVVHKVAWPDLTYSIRLYAGKRYLAGLEE